MLRPVEAIAIECVFAGDSELERTILEQLGTATSTAYEETGVGFFSTVKLLNPLVTVPEPRTFDYNFEYPELTHGGSFICRVVNATTLEVEGVTFGGETWPQQLDKTQLAEME